VFQNSGIFDPQRYRQILSTARLDPESFEEMQKESMLIQKLMAIIVGTVKVSDAEAGEWFRWQNASVAVDFVLFDPLKYQGITPSQAEIEKYFQENQSSYKTEPKLKVRYLYFDPAQFVPDVRINPEEITAYYEANLDQFKTPETVEARHILITVPPEASEAQVEAAKKRADEIAALARSGKDFAELAKEYSEGPTKDRGGYLGTFSRNQMIEPFAAKAFAMKPGETSEPVRTEFGWHVIKVEKHNPESTLPPDKAKEKIREKFTQEKSKQLAYEKAEGVYDTLFDGDDLKTVAEQKKLTLKTVDEFTRKGPQEVKNPAQFATVAFELSPMQISQIQDFEDGFYILQVTEKIPETIPELKIVEAKVRQDLIQQKQNEKAQADARDFLKAIREGKSFQEESAKHGVEPVRSGFFKRNEAIPDLGHEPAVSAAAFKLTAETPLPEDAIKGQKGYFVVRFQERKEPDAESFEKEKADVRQGLIQMKQQKTFEAWLASVRGMSEISIEKGFLGSEKP